MRTGVKRRRVERGVTATRSATARLQGRVGLRKGEQLDGCARRAGYTAGRLYEPLVHTAWDTDTHQHTHTPILFARLHEFS